MTNLACLDAVASVGVTDDEIGDSLKILHDEHYIKLSGMIGPTYRNTHVSHLRIDTHTFESFARAKWPEYEAILAKLVAGLVNEGWRSNTDIAKLDAPARLRDHLIRELEQNGNIRISRHFGGYSIWEVSPKLKRALADR